MIVQSGLRLVITQERKSNKTRHGVEINYPRLRDPFRGKVKEVSRGRGKGTEESSADNPGFSSRGPGWVKARFPAPPARNPQATFVLKVLSVIQDKAACHPTQRHRLQSPAAPGTHSPHSEVPGAASKTQELTGRP